MSIDRNYIFDFLIRGFGLKFVVIFGSVRVMEASDKLKFVGYFGGTDRSYSQRNAIIGFTFAARRAGIQQAINPAIAISNATAP